MGLKRVSWVRRYQGQCRGLQPLGHQGYRLRNYKKDPPLCSGYMYTDMGKEFDNELIRMVAERYGITLHCAPVGSHWSLGDVERHHYQLSYTVELLLEADDTLSLQDACDVACMSLNYHPMPDRGFSPQQSVYGVSSRWPDFVAAKLPALAETPVPSDHVGHYMVKFLDAMYRAREKFHAADVRAKVLLAKRSRPSTNRQVALVTGDTLFYFESLEKGKDSWHGPAVVIGADGDFVVLRHGGSVRRVPLLHCRPASAVLGSPDVDPGLRLWQCLMQRNRRWKSCSLTRRGMS